MCAVLLITRYPGRYSNFFFLNSRLELTVLLKNEDLFYSLSDMDDMINEDITHVDYQKVLLILFKSCKHLFKNSQYLFLKNLVVQPIVQV